MSYLNSLESSVNRRRWACCRPQYFNAIVASLALFAIFITTILIIIYSMQPAPFTPSVPYKQTLTEGKQHFKQIQDTIQTRLATELPLQKDSLEQFQKEQLILSQHYHTTHGHDRLSNLLSSLYTPTPIFVPNAEYLIALHGSCHPVNPFQSSIHDGRHQNKEQTAPHTNSSPSSTTTSQNTPTNDSVCYPCDQYLMDQFPTNSEIISKDLCQTIPYVSIYECDNTQPTQDGKAKTTKVIPCSVAFVDGTSQFWAMYAIATIVIIVSSVAVRKRFDKAQDKVMTRISKSLR